jgi:WD repeat-containing protein 48
MTPLPPRLTTIEDGNVGNRPNDYFTSRARRPSVSTSTPAVPPSPDDFSSWGTPRPGDTAVPQTPTTPGGGLMGRLKAFGKGVKRQASEGLGVAGSAPNIDSETGIVSRDFKLINHIDFFLGVHSPYH